jgi:hypothetical protein
MKHIPITLAEAPTLSDEGAVEILNFLYDLTTAFENYYFVQLRQHNQIFPDDPNQRDLFEPLDDELPDF